MRLEVILADRTTLDEFNRKYIEDLKECYRKGLGMPLGKTYLNIAEYNARVYMNTYYNEFVLTFTAGKKMVRK